MVLIECYCYETVRIEEWNGNFGLLRRPQLGIFKIQRPVQRTISSSIVLMNRKQALAVATLVATSLNVAETIDSSRLFDCLNMQISYD